MQDANQRKTWYSQVANAYNRVRPRYPKQLISRAVELANLPANANILEIGCGPGTATTSFAELGFSMVCLEPSQAACEIARQNCASYPKVEIKNTTFEDWQLETEKFNAVLAATSFHWIAPEIRYIKAAAALQPNGSLILLWNVVPPLPNDDIYPMLEQVYQAHAPSLVKPENRTIDAENLINFGQNAIDSGQFKNLLSEQLNWEVTHSVDDYLALLSTLSPYIGLESQQRDALFTGLRNALERNCLKSIQISYLSVCQIAEKMYR